MMRFLIPIFLLATLLQACGFKNEQAHLIIHNANIITMDPELPEAEAMAIRDGRIIELGPERKILNKYRADQIVDARKQFVYPGFIDAHCHLLAYGLGLQEANLTGTSSWDEVLESVKSHAGAYPDGWLVGRGWDQNDWPVQQYPDRAALDSLFPDRPVLLTRVDGHAALVNAKALDMAGVTPGDTILGGAFEVVEGRLTGILIDKAVDKVSALVPLADRSAKEQALMEAQERCFAVGLTTVSIAGLDHRDIALIDSMQEAGALKMRVYAMLSDTQENIDEWLDRGPMVKERLSVRSFKFYADGALGSRGACLIRPYSDQMAQKHVGFLLDSIEHFRNRALQMHNAGFQMNTHCIGDSANRTILQLYGEVLEGSNDLRWRIEHAQVVHREDIPLFGAYSVIPSVQPTHATSDMYWAELRLGRNRLRRAYAYKDLLAQNGMLALGTDFPVEGISPINTFYAATVRKDAEGYPEGGFLPENALTRDEALMGMTLWAALSNFEEEQKGSLTVGKLADFTVLDRDLREVPDDEILPTGFLQTWINGEQVWKSE